MPPAPPITWEAALDPAVAPRLLRHPAIAARRAGPTRSAPLVLEWRNTPDGALAEAGLAVEEPRGGPPLLLHAIPPAAAIACPATPAWPAEGDPPTGATAVLATFLGRRATLALAEGVEARLLRGALRRGDDERPVARLALTGPAEAVAATMRDLAGTLPLLPPLASLAEEARALGAGTGVRAPRLGAPLLDPGMGVEDALRHVIGHLACVLAWHAPVAQAGRHPAGVHQMRVALRRLRSALRAFRPAVDGPALREADRRLKALAALLGPARDWDVFLGGLGAELAGALPGEARVTALLEAARARRDQAYANLADHLRGPAFRLLLWDLCALVACRPWQLERDDPVEEVAAGLLARRWRKITAAGEDIAALPDADFHALRLEAKRMRYLAELFAPLWGRKRGRRFLERLAAVQEQMGLANDAAVARALVAPLGTEGGSWATGLAEGWVLARSRRARSRAAKAWEELLKADPFWNQG
ncbi:CHAD domain-containing protein [Falsiroseomonas ponticola]|uniref:CHAD domain-containing protein n=1 Tax=Falsiroseomonas ponticola TaxID=2786951 RepID=UPI0019330C3E|nr:CHAD domain-containing protein [Roseomonas ponticola]